MGNDLIAWIVAITLGAAVIVLGWRRNLGETTRNWLPRFERASKQAAVTPGSFDGGRKRHQYSPRQRRWLIGGYLLLSLCNATLALPWANDRVFHAIIAALFALLAVALWLKKWPFSVDERPKSDRPRSALPGSSSAP